ncbi:MAG: hypothetical protein MJ165_03960 [Alphaproteobacteria bacterium]|nr:hypothetical protein [Alphaproteobacteria bacterium]
MDNAEANKKALESFKNDEKYEIYDDIIFFNNTKTLLLLGDDVILVFDKDVQQYYGDKFIMDANTKKQATKTMKRYKAKVFVQNKLPSYIALVTLLIVVACYIVNTNNEKARQTRMRELKNKEIQESKKQQIDPDTICDYRNYKTVVETEMNQNLPQQKTL